MTNFDLQKAVKQSINFKSITEKWNIKQKLITINKIIIIGFGIWLPGFRYCQNQKKTKKKRMERERKNQGKRMGRKWKNRGKEGCEETSDERTYKRNCRWGIVIHLGCNLTIDPHHPEHSTLSSCHQSEKKKRKSNHQYFPIVSNIQIGIISFFFFAWKFRKKSIRSASVICIHHYRFNPPITLFCDSS